MKKLLILAVSLSMFAMFYVVSSAEATPAAITATVTSPVYSNISGSIDINDPLYLSLKTKYSNLVDLRVVEQNIHIQIAQQVVDLLLKVS